MRQGQGCWQLNDTLKVPNHALHEGHTNNVVVLSDFLSDSTFSFAFRKHSNTEKVHMACTKKPVCFSPCNCRWCISQMVCNADGARPPVRVHNHECFTLNRATGSHARYLKMMAYCISSQAPRQYVDPKSAHRNAKLEKQRW